MSNHVFPVFQQLIVSKNGGNVADWIVVQTEYPSLPEGPESTAAKQQAIAYIEVATQGAAGSSLGKESRKSG